VALTAFQREISRLLSVNRRAPGESYVAGGAALNLVLDSGRLSRDLDLFHDNREAVHSSWEADRRLLESNGFTMRNEIERDTLVEVVASRGG
jgi:hypothetical protein